MVGREKSQSNKYVCDYRKLLNFEFENVPHLRRIFCESRWNAEIREASLLVQTLFSRGLFPLKFSYVDAEI
jgi:hypothetical protein